MRLKRLPLIPERLGVSPEDAQALRASVLASTPESTVPEQFGASPLRFWWTVLHMLSFRPLLVIGGVGCGLLAVMQLCWRLSSGLIGG